MTPGNPRRGNGWFDMEIFWGSTITFGAKKKQTELRKHGKQIHDSCLKKVDFYGSCEQETEDDKSKIP